MPGPTHERLVRSVARNQLDSVEFYDRAIPAPLATYKPQRPGQKYARPDAVGYRDEALAAVEVDQVSPGLYREQVIRLGTNEVLYERLRQVRASGAARSGASVVGAAAFGALAGHALNEATGRKVAPEAAVVGGALIMLLLATR